ncbi:hypothetical protein [Acetivibrio saccincola]|jgi:uncharacterized protein with PIN domain|uniref:Uncharacterized protein n=1 Tax=Acetivibrio saccincola TaxID=1677857 RepID=A0A2K9E0E5_9FIRM|nr:hypothetical protein [Acetivibrio saccincola]AUG56849.1 hypothetical protein HVS_04560 [Acetivibrio saccincola]
MANISGPQPEIKYCPICKGDLQNVPRDKMKTKKGPEHTHTYDCLKCSNRFEINQAQ